MRPVWIGQVTGHEHNVGCQLAKQLRDNRDVGGTNRILAHLPRLVERQIQEPCVSSMQAHHLEPTHGLGLADKTFDILHQWNIHRARALGIEERAHRPGQLARRRAFPDMLVIESFQKVDVAADVVIEHGDVPARHVGDGDVVRILDELAENATHRDHVVVGMRGEADDALPAGQLALAANFGPECVKHHPVDGARRAVT